jgi:hypothetical protein
VVRVWAARVDFRRGGLVAQLAGITFGHLDVHAATVAPAARSSKAVSCGGLARPAPPPARSSSHHSE